MTKNKTKKQVSSDSKNNENNSFEGHKSYHVVGHWKNFFGGYYHNQDYGFGHWSHHDKMP